MTETDELVCWRCGHSLAAVGLPLRRLEECPDCAAELHVCKLCEFYDTGVARSCREPVAEEVRDKERANFCDYFRPAPGAWTSLDDERTAAQQRLHELFGDSGAAADDDPNDKLKDLFGDD